MMYEMIEHWADMIDEELDGAKAYSERYLAEKEQHPAIAAKYREMSEDELKHACYLRDIADAGMQNLMPEQEAVWEYEKSRMEKCKVKLKKVLAL